MNEVLDLECQVRFIEIASVQDPNDTPLDLFADGFWQGVLAAAMPRSKEQLEQIIDMHRARAAGLIR